MPSSNDFGSLGSKNWAELEPSLESVKDALLLEKDWLSWTTYQGNPFKLCWDHFSRCKGGKEELKWGSNRSLKTSHSIYKGAGGKRKEIKDRRTFLGGPIKFVQDNAEKHDHSGNRRDYKVIFPLADLLISSDSTPRTYKISNSLFTRDRSIPFTYLPLQAPSVVS